ncbi:MarR family winged helix-turn-helix transcriptional regulator [Rhodovarius crocodyli]|nr:MarR family winged helix-turn-helix transcriptional regulator [Rhodovarius crocodyli]
MAKKALPAAHYVPPLTVSHPALLAGGRDVAFRETLYLMVLTLGQLLDCREAFGRRAGMTGSQFAVLFGVAYSQGAAKGASGVTIRALSHHVQMADTHVTTEVGRLTRRGLLEKRPNAADGRSVLVSLSPEGRDMVEALAPYIRAVNDRLFDGIGAEDMARLGDILGRVAANNQAVLAALKE